MKCENKRYDFFYNINENKPEYNGIYEALSPSCHQRIPTCVYTDINISCIGNYLQNMIDNMEIIFIIDGVSAIC